MTDLEIRAFVEPVEFRSTDGKITATGTAIRYGARSKNMGGFVERIMPGAPTKAMENRDITAFHEHPHPGQGGYDRLLGRTSNGSLRLANDDVELRYEIDLPDTGPGRDAAYLLERRDLTGTSFGFRSNKATDVWTRAEKGLALRSVHDFTVFDHIALTCTPAYESSSAELAFRSLADATGFEMRDILDAAEHRTLADLIESAPSDEKPSDDVVVIPIRRRLTSLFL